MSGLSESRQQRRITEFAGAPAPRVAKHLPTNHSYQVALLIPNTCVHLKDVEGREVTVCWPDWINADIWREIP